MMKFHNIQITYFMITSDDNFLKELLSPESDGVKHPDIKWTIFKKSFSPNSLFSHILVIQLLRVDIRRCPLTFSQELGSIFTKYCMKQL